ncbi:MAG: tRNA epoxyqueuosine(34) reductase QueG, partial [Muribaculaceae bacterium]|nr:tRNA epoxyqueuosine(34) reductase QueG [Muribaculaceae bacterium]
MRLKREIEAILIDSGAVAAGAAVAGEVDPEAFERYRLWLEEGNAAGMDYLTNQLPLRRDPRLLLQHAKTI